MKVNVHDENSEEVIKDTKNIIDRLLIAIENNKGIRLKAEELQTLRLTILAEYERGDVR